MGGVHNTPRESRIKPTTAASAAIRHIRPLSIKFAKAAAGGEVYVNP